MNLATVLLSSAIADLRSFGIRVDFAEKAMSRKSRHVRRCLDTINKVYIYAVVYETQKSLYSGRR